MNTFKEPLEHKVCPVCNRPYSFIRARVTLQDPKREICISCGKDEELSQRNEKAPGWNQSAFSKKNLKLL